MMKHIGLFSADMPDENTYAAFLLMSIEAVRWDGSKFAIFNSTCGPFKKYLCPNMGMKNEFKRYKEERGSLKKAYKLIILNTNYMGSIIDKWNYF